METVEAVFESQVVWGLLPIEVELILSISISIPYQSVQGPITWYQSMTTNKEIIEKLEIDVNEVHEGIRRLEKVKQVLTSPPIACSRWRPPW
jgi:hypothetical protein